MRRVVVPEFLPEEQVSRLADHFEVVYDPDLYADRGRLLDAVASADALVVRNRTLVDPSLLAAAPRLRAVGRLGVGLDNIDVAACTAAGVEVHPAVGANAVSVAEYVLGAMLVLVRGVYGMTGSMVAGRWPRQGHAFGRELSGMSLGLVGFGSIARLVAARAGAFGMEVRAHDPYLPSHSEAWGEVRAVALDELLDTSDVVSLHVPLTEETRNLIAASRIARMKHGAVIINTSRGGILDEEAVAAALREGRLGGAAFDVFETEPLGPEAAARFVGIENLLLTPHLAGNTVESVERVARATVDAVLGALWGAPT